MGQEPTRVHDTATALLRSAGQRYTPGRRTVVAALAAAEHPLTVSEIVGREAGDASLPQSSVYRNLTVLESAGVVRRVVAVDEFSRYELSEALTGHHHHLLCTDCGHVEDFVLDDDMERRLTAALDSASKTRGFTGAQHRLDLVGVCADCQSA